MQQSNNNADLEKIYKLAVGYIHQGPREKIIKSHLRHLKSFHTFQQCEFQKFIVDKYLEYREQKKVFSVAYYKSVIESVLRHRKVKTFEPRDIYKIVANLNKMFNPENKDTVFYTDIGERVKLNIKTEKGTGDDGFSKSYKNQFCRKLYSEESFELVRNHYKSHLDNFLASQKKTPDLHDELALLIVFLTCCPKRVNEIINLSMEKVDDLIIRCSTEIKSKMSTSVDLIVIPNNFSTILQKYKFKVDPDYKKSSLFTYGYNKFYTIYKRNLKTILGDTIPYDNYRNLCFHAFRHYFAKNNIDVNSKMTMKLMSHKSSKMTRSYANKQNDKTTQDDMKLYINKISKI